MSLISMISSMSSMVSQIGPGFKAAGSMAMDALKNLGKWFNDTVIQPIRDAVDSVGEKWDALKEMVGAVFTSIGETALGVLGTLWDLLQELPAVFTLEFWTGLFESIGETVGGWLTAVWDLLPDIPPIFTLEFWTGLFESIGDTVGGWAGAIWDMLPEMPDFLTAQYWIDLFTFDMPDWDAMFSFELPDWLQTSVDFLLGNGGFAGFSIGDRLDLAIGELPQPFKFIADLFQGVFGISIGDYIDFGISLVGDAWDFIKKLINDPLGTFADLGTSIAGWASGLGETFGGLLKAPINGMIGLVNEFFEGFSFSKTIDLPGLDPFTIGFDLSDWSIPQLAKGGIVNKPTLAMIGEDGPEAVIPLTQRNNPQGAGMGGGTVNVTVNASGITDRTDKRTLAREIGNMIQQEMARNIGGTTMRGRY